MTGIFSSTGLSHKMSSASPYILLLLCFADIRDSITLELSQHPGTSLRRRMKLYRLFQFLCFSFFLLHVFWIILPWLIRFSSQICATEVSWLVPGWVYQLLLCCCSECLSNLSSCCDQTVLLYPRAEAQAAQSAIHLSVSFISVSLFVSLTSASFLRFLPLFSYYDYGMYPVLRSHVSFAPSTVSDICSRMQASSFAQCNHLVCLVFIAFEFSGRFCDFVVT